MMMEVSRPPEYASTTFSAIYTPRIRAAHLAAKQQQQDGLLHVQAAFGLVKDHGAVTIHNGVRDLHPAVRGQAVHEDGVRRCASHERFVDLVGRENPVPLLLFVLVTHAGPGISIDRVCALHSLFRIVENLNDGAGLPREITGISYNLRVASIACRRGNMNLRAE